MNTPASIQSPCAPPGTPTSQALDKCHPFPGARGDLKPLTDDTLVARTRAGDVAAFEELLGRHEENLLRLALRFVRNEHDAQEVLQDVFVTTWRKLPGFEERSQIGSWLYRVTVNASLMHLRVRKRRPAFEALSSRPQAVNDGSFETDWSAASVLQPDEQLESQELRSTIQNAVDKLPASLRSVFLAREVQGCSTRQTARQLGLRETTVKTRMYRARRALREDVEGYLVP